MKRRILSIITALALCLSLCPTWALAAEGEPDTGLCDHHPEHIGCGYAAPTEGHPCGHQHTAECYTLGVLPDGDSGEYYEIGADTENLLDCHHSHDSECGYVQAEPGTPCGYECRICPIEDLIAALPSRVTEDNRADMEAQLQKILDLCRELSDEEAEQVNLSRCLELQAELDAANAPAPIAETVSAAYREASWNGSAVVYADKSENCTVVESSTEAVTWDAGWYVVNSTVTISEPITVTGAVNLILADGCTLNAEKGIVVTTGNSLTIYAQSGGSGTLIAIGTADDSRNASAGIGGSIASVDSGTIFIHGGVINATGGGQSNSPGGAGIGGGASFSENGGSSGTITIYGGTVTANSGTGDTTGAGIGGGGSQQQNGGAGRNITIYGGSVTAASTGTGTGGAGIGGGGGLTGGGIGSNIQICGGTVNATGGNKGAGIGGGGSGVTNNDDVSQRKSGDGSITIIGGSVTAVGGDYAAGIGGGGGYYFSNSYSGITFSGGCTGGAGSVTISGGIVDASSPTDVYYSDYKGAPIGKGGNTSEEATVSKTTGIVFENGAGTVYGTVTLTEPYTVPDGYSLTFAEDGRFNGNYAFYQNDSPIAMETVKDGGVTGPVTVGTCEHTGVEATNSGDGTHSVNCPYCGYTGASADCTYGAYTTTNGTHTRACTACGYKETGVCDYKYTPAETNDGGHRKVCKVCADTVNWEQCTSGPSEYNGNGSHNKRCIHCKQLMAIQSCEYTYTDNGDGTHTRACKFGGHDDVTHPTVLTATASGSAVTLSEGCATCRYKKELGTVSFTFENLVYGNPDAKVTFTNIPANYTLMCQDKQRDDGMAEVSWTLAQLFGGTKVTAGKHKLKVSFFSDVRSNECELDFTIDPAPLTPSITGTAAKTYDGTTDVASDQLSITLTGVVGSDNVTAAATSYAYDNANAGENKTITASGITLGGADAGNYELSSTTATTTGTITKSQPTIAFVSGYNPSKDYDGQTIPNPVADNLTITGAAFGNVDFTWSATPKDAGTYTLTAKIAETNNTEAASATLSVTISPKTVSGSTIDLSASSFVYDGSEKKPAVTVKDGGTVIPASEYTVGYSNNTNAGNATVTITNVAGNYAVSGTKTFTISAKPLTGAKVEVTGTFTYTGSALTPAPTVTLDGKPLVKDTDYTVAYADNTNAGAAKITVTGTGNYSGTAQGTFTIGRADLTVEGTGIASGTYGDKLSALTVSGLTAKLGEGTVSGTWKLAGDAVPNVGDSGEYTATFTPASGADNYNPLTAKVKLNIAKANYSGTMAASTSAKFGTTGTYDLTALLPDGATAETATTASDIFEGTPTVSGKTLTYTLKAGATVGSTGTITVSITSTNYNDFNLTITVKVTEKEVPTLTVSPITVTYTGEAVPASAIKGTAKVGNTTVPGTWSFAEGQALTNVADSGTKTVKFVPSDKETYTEATGTVVVTINKATPTGAPKYTAISASGKTLADAGLTTEGSTLKPEGTVAWTLADTTEVTANTAYEWTFTPTNAANYSTLTGKITLWVQSTGGGSYVPSGPSSPGTSTLPVTTTGQGSTTTTTTTTAAPTANTQGGTATTTINTTMGQEIVKQAVANNSETVVIAPKVTGSVTKAEVSIPASTVGQIGSQTSASLTVSTPVADVTIPNGGLGSLGSAGGTVTVTAEQTGNSVELTVTAGGQTVQNVPGGVTLTVPAASTTPGTVAVLVHPDGTRQVVRKSVADNGAVTIPLDGSAKLEIVDNSGYFADVPATSWAADAVAFASSHELFNGTAPGQFSPNVPMSRGMLAVVLHNLESNPAQALTGAFTDVDNSQWYAEGVAWAEAQGIIGGYGNGQFGPNDNITREQLAVMLWRYSGSPAATDRELHFADAYRASDWALEALRWATENGIINGKGGGILDPTGQATRAETAQMLKNYMENQ